MTTAREVKKLVQPLLERNPDLSLNGPWLFIKPIHHVLRVVLIGRTGQARRFEPRWATLPLSEPLESVALNWGAQLYRPGLWDWNDEGNAERLIEVVEKEALPVLRSIVTLDDFAAYFNRPGFHWNPFCNFVFSYLPFEVARGDLESARAICERLMKQRTADWGIMQEDFDRVMQTLCPLVMADDRAGMVRLLREWQTYTIRKLKIENIWEPTPLPLEMTS